MSKSVLCIFLEGSESLCDPIPESRERQESGVITSVMNIEPEDVTAEQDVTLIYELHK